MNEWQMDIDMKSSAERIEGERERRLKLAANPAKIGVPFLDQALKGLRRNDILLLGADSGAGKTELATLIARTNVELGKRVYYFALEAEEDEIEHRIQYQHICKLFYADPKRPKIDLSYSDWLYGLLDRELEHYEFQTQQHFAEKYQKLHTIYRRGDFGLAQYEKTMLAIKDRADLIICDHLNYFDHDERQAENVAITQIMKRIRDLGLIYGVPQVIVSHIRKKDRSSKAIMPELEDFFGSSNAYKIATMAVLVAGASGERGTTPHEWPTYIRVPKNRVEGPLKRYIARCIFDSRSNRYLTPYSLGHWKPGLEQFESICDERELPRWARKK